MKSRLQHSKASVCPSNRAKRDRTQGVMLDQKTLYDMRKARDLLKELTGSRVLLIGDPNDLPCVGEVPPRDSQTLVLPICRQTDPTAAAEATALMISQLQLLVEVEMPNILQGGSKTKLRLAFEGFNRDEPLFANDEVRAWARNVFILNVPQAIGVLEEASYQFIAICCNDLDLLLQSDHVQGKRNLGTGNLQPEWVAACNLGGIDATQNWPW
ncbi:hypothetical protein [Noviherbaspirillum malthae]|uniref:hypothetical protein n=1 Tax=Noviherbaspirillum malthae TaxID=1260987 RepID=UPI00188F5B22|nr:hypothetical protein [Noviherbaspirillum malthae]